VGSNDDAFAALAGQKCPSVGDVLLVLTGAFQRVDPDAMDAQLDDLARPLFAVEAWDRPARLALLLDEFAHDELSVAGLWLDEVVRTRRGHPMLIAAVGAELGRRAGLETGVFSTPTEWYAGILEEDRLWLIDVAARAAGVPAPETVRRHCGHELAFAALTGLAERFTGPGADVLRRRAARLRDRLAIEPQRPAGTDLLAALWPSQ
jgi:hypothetical protein